MPLSPHLTVYKPQFSSTYSIFHRITGAILAFFILCYILVVHFCTLSTITVTPFYDFIGGIANLSTSEVQNIVGCILDYWYVNLAIFLLMSLFFHICHGFRHFIWDRVSLIRLHNNPPHVSGIAAAYDNHVLTKSALIISVITITATILVVFI